MTIVNFAIAIGKLKDKRKEKGKSNDKQSKSE